MVASSKKESSEKSRFLPRLGDGGGGSWEFSLPRRTKLKSASGSVGVRFGVPAPYFAIARR